MTTTPVRPKDIKPGDILRVESLNEDLSIISEDKTIESIESLGRQRYRMSLSGETSPRYISARHDLNVVPQAP